jgi:pilus assembly protein CpaB
VQNQRAILFLILAVALGVGAAFTAQRWLEQQRQQPVGQKSATQPVAVMRQSMQVGQVVHARELATVDWPVAYVPQGAHSDPAQLEGRVLRRPLAAGEPVLEMSLLPEGARAGLISVIDPSHRAISVKVDPVVGVAGFVVPGAHVDVLVTISRIDSDGRPVSQVILQDVQVLAIDQKLEEAKEGEPELVQVVTLETNPSEAEKLTYAAHEGRLQLALRNPSDHEIVETHSVGVGDVLNEHRPAPPTPRIASHPVARPRGASVEVIKGSQVSVQSF